MNHAGGRGQRLVLRLVEFLLRRYPPQFRGEFATEMRAVLLSRLREAAAEGRAAWLAAAFQELAALVISILRERWHAHGVSKEKMMSPEDGRQQDKGAAGGGMPTLRPAGTSSFLWVAGWTALTAAAIPAALIAMAPLAVLFTRLIDLGVEAGFWPAAQQSTAELLGLLIGLALMLALAQWYLLRRVLPRAWLWFVATGAGVLLGAIVMGLVLSRFSWQSWDSLWLMAAVLLPLGLALGVAQWLYLRRFVARAYRIILIDVLATGSILLAGRSFTSLVELMILVLPGAISGLGMWLLLNQNQIGPQARVRSGASRRWPRPVQIGLGLVVLVPLFFAGSWVYAASQLTLAKNEGIYGTVEEAVMARNSQGYGGAEVIRIEDVRAGPNSPTAQPHVWFGAASVYLDRVPEGGRRDHYSAGSFYIHVQEGWVHVPEGAFPKFIGWVMALYGMEGAAR